MIPRQLRKCLLLQGKSSLTARLYRYLSEHVLHVSQFHHERINHSELFAVKQNHINGIENFGVKPIRYSKNIIELTEKIFLYP